MNSEWPIQETEKKETKINIGEVYFDKGLEDVFDKDEFTSEVQKMNKEIEEYLGENKNSSIYDFRVYSDRKEYEEYFKAHFPEKYDNFMENDILFYCDKNNNKNVIAKFMERATLNSSDLNIQKYLKKENITFSELEAQSRQNYKNNIYPTIAHELTHSHSFFEGVTNDDLENKWSQEMICVFIDQKMWEKYTSSYKKMIQDRAREQAQNKDLYGEIIKDFEEGDFHSEDWERLFYPFLENRYGKEKLVKFWSDLFKEKADLEKCFEMIFGEKLKDAMELFQEKILKEK